VQTPMAVDPSWRLEGDFFAFLEGLLWLLRWHIQLEINVWELEVDWIRREEIPFRGELSVSLDTRRELQLIHPGRTHSRNIFSDQSKRWIGYPCHKLRLVSVFGKK
jgi:hypothetical protein